MKIDVSNIPEMKMSGECLQNLLKDASSERIDELTTKLDYFIYEVEKIHHKLIGGAVIRYHESDAIKDLADLLGKR